MLPRIHRALKSDDFIRGNAAMVCESIGDPSSVGPLAEALGMDSQFARSRIVSALAERPSSGVFPALSELYAEAIRVELRDVFHGGGGQWGGIASGAVYESLDLLATLQKQSETIRREESNPHLLHDDQQSPLTADDLFMLIEIIESPLLHEFFVRAF